MDLTQQWSLESNGLDTAMDSTQQRTHHSNGLNAAMDSSQQRTHHSNGLSTTMEWSQHSSTLSRRRHPARYSTTDNTSSTAQVLLLFVTHRTKSETAWQAGNELPTW